MNIPSLFSHFSLHVLIDFSIVLTLVLGLIYFLASGRLYNLLKLIGIVFCLYAISILFQFDFLYSILNQYSLFFFILIIILFQADLPFLSTQICETKSKENAELLSRILLANNELIKLP